MTFHDTRFPTSISYGSSGGPDWAVDIVRFRSGREVRNQLLQNPVYSYDVRNGVQTRAQMAALVAFHHGRRGAVHTFPYKDWKDFRTSSDGRSPVSATDQSIGPGDGVRTVFALTKTYPDAVNPFVRTKLLPVTATVLVAVGGVPKASGDATYPWTVDRLARTLTFTGTPPPVGAVTWGGDFDVELRFEKGKLDVRLTTDRTLDVSVRLIEPGDC